MRVSLSLLLVSSAAVVPVMAFNTHSNMPRAVRRATPDYEAASPPAYSAGAPESTTTTAPPAAKSTAAKRTIEVPHANAPMIKKPVVTTPASVSAPTVTTPAPASTTAAKRAFAVPHANGPMIKRPIVMTPVSVVPTAATTPAPAPTPAAPTTAAAPAPAQTTTASPATYAAVPTANTMKVTKPANDQAKPVSKIPTNGQPQQKTVRGYVEETEAPETENSMEETLAYISTLSKAGGESQMKTKREDNIALVRRVLGGLEKLGIVMREDVTYEEQPTDERYEAVNLHAMDAKNPGEDDAGVAASE
ncbi:hypothetical protein EXIGLDRAFT_731493 [Exidia glandulosa HHB12029]|uniref:Uncharacterized protein n=1 Tax=Exidia glandulosa HHB12029 TaxID=1314781 RepID=A0A165L1Y3_EXIGL|nr:hypothetical protein EXIGLDRAFT_731493 [Exidia glandulosa HHB12029]